ncbi:MAG: molecular chaperone TorD family protein [Chloroflexales bacterium]|nr:molecular chaperone TorD family protein [Chloroflexales bacterium]
MITLVADEKDRQARQAAYEFLAWIYLDEPSAPLLDYVRDLPGFTELVHSGALEDLQVEYQRLFGINVYPYESIFIDRELMLNSAATDRVVRLYQACGFDTLPAHVGAADHLGLELRLMAHLIVAERYAAGRADETAVQWARAQQARCLHEHLARWAPILAQSLVRVATQPLYSAAATLTTELVLTDLGTFPSAHWIDELPIVSRESATEGQFAAPDPQLLDLFNDLDPEAPIPLRPYTDTPSEAGEDERGIGRIVRQLLTPQEVGVFLSRADIGSLGQALQLPLPMGERFQMMRGLFDAAGQFDQIPALLDGLMQLFVQAEEMTATLIANYPAWTSYGQFWQQRIASGQALISEMRDQVSNS